MSHGLAPYVGFDQIPFRVQADGASGVYPDWVWSPVITVRHIPGSNTAVVQHMGTPPATLTLALSFHGMADYRSFLRRQGVTSTLTLLANFTSAVGTIEHLVGVDYEHLDGVTLLAVRSAAIEVGQEWVDCTATFQRAMDPLTGLAS